MNAPTLDQIKTYAAKFASGSKLASIDQKALHTYRAPDGAPLYWRIRLKCNSTGVKWIRPFYWDGESFTTGEPLTPPEGKPLYGLERLTASPDALVIITEGESCADALNRLFAQSGTSEFIAMTSGGAQSAGTANWQPLADRRVIVWPDNDEQGAKYAADVLEVLCSIAAFVAVLDISGLNLKIKGDAVDWLADGGDYDGLMLLVDATRTGNVTDKSQAAQGDDDRVGCDSSNLIESVDATTLPEGAAQSGAQPKQSDDEVIQWLASLRPLEYDRERKGKAAALKVRPATLDGMVKAARSEKGEAGRLPFIEIEPHPHPILPAQLLSEVSDTIQRFIVLDTEQAHAAALWVSLTWFIDVVEVAPLVIINAPEKSCGKTQLLTVIGRMAYRPLPASNASASALFRAVELWKPTILIDEADTFFRDNTELHGMVNAGYLRDGYVLRSEAIGDTFEPRMFSVFSAKALAGIALEKHLPDATMSRGIVLNLRRKLSHESVSRLRHADRDLFSVLAEKLARFAADYSQQVRQARPLLPDALSDRDQDNWDGLLAIASCAGDEWLRRATAAALKLSGAGEKTVSTGNELLADIQHVFESKKLDKISTVDLIAALCEDEECAWATYNRGKPLAPRQLAKQLNGYGIASKNIKRGSYEVYKGFELSQFTDAFVRYLPTPLNLSLLSPYPLQANSGAGCEVADKLNASATRYHAATAEAPYSLGCSGVADKLPILASVETPRPDASHLRI